MLHHNILLWPGIVQSQLRECQKKRTKSKQTNMYFTISFSRYDPSNKRIIDLSPLYANRAWILCHLLHQHQCIHSLVSIDRYPWNYRQGNTYLCRMTGVEGNRKGKTKIAQREREIQRKTVNKIILRVDDRYTIVAISFGGQGMMTLI